MYYDLIAWDFNGTIMDDVKIGLGATNILLRRRGLPEVSLARYYRIFGFPVIDYYRRIGFDFEKESYDDVAVEWTVEYTRLEREGALRDGVLPLLAAVQAAGILQAVLSASEQGNLCRQLAGLGVSTYFAEVCGRNDVSGADKSALVLDFARRHVGKCMLLIGDTDHDAECAALAGMDCALVAGGHQSIERLETVKGARVYPDFATLRAQLFGGTPLF